MWLYAGAAASAAAAGAAWRLLQPSAAAPGPQPDAAAEAFWAMTFTQPDDTLLSMASLRGAPLVLNFWGTWCPPCVKEMPELDRFAREARASGVRVLGVAVDSPTAVRQFLGRQPVAYAIALAGFDGTDLSRRLGNSTGALPFTAVFNRAGAVVQRKLGTTGVDELRAWVSAL
jgi:thiol-disulfide isomerase/thioredoxin